MGSAEQIYETLFVAVKVLKKAQTKTYRTLFVAVTFLKKKQYKVI